MLSPLWIYFTLVHSTPSIALPYPFPSTPHFSTFFSTYHHILYLHRCYVLCYCWCSFSFPFPPSLSSIEQFHYYKHVLHISLYMFLFVYMFIFWIFHIQEKACCLCLFESGLLHLTWCFPIAFIYFQTTWCHSSLWLNKTPLCVRMCVCIAYMLCIYISIYLHV
jgi:hypothetical protein